MYQHWICIFISKIGSANEKISKEKNIEKPQKVLRVKFFNNKYNMDFSRQIFFKVKVDFFPPPIFLEYRFGSREKLKNLADRIKKSKQLLSKHEIF